MQADCLICFKSRICPFPPEERIAAALTNILAMLNAVEYSFCQTLLLLLNLIFETN